MKVKFKEVKTVLKALHSGASGLNAQQIKVDVLAKNIANVNTPGYKKSRADFSELVSQEIINPYPPGETERKISKVGGGVRVAEVTRFNKPGNLIETGRPLDLAIRGEGFYKVVSPGGEELYTRDGSFTLDQEGNLLSSGCKLEGVKLDPGWDKVVISPDGKVLVEAAGSTTENGQITLYKFSDINNLRVAGESHFLFDGANGEVISGNPGSQEFGTVHQNYLEASDVDLTDEMVNLVEANLAYRFNARALRAVDEMWGMANNLRK